MYIFKKKLSYLYSHFLLNIKLICIVFVINLPTLSKIKIIIIEEKLFNFKMLILKPYLNITLYIT